MQLPSSLSKALSEISPPQFLAHKDNVSSSIQYSLSFVHSFVICVINSSHNFSTFGVDRNLALALRCINLKLAQNPPKIFRRDEQSLRALSLLVYFLQECHKPPKPRKCTLLLKGIDESWHPWVTGLYRRANLRLAETFTSGLPLDSLGKY